MQSVYRIKTLFSVGILSSLLLLTGCVSRPKTVTVQVVATADVHGRIFDKDCIDGSDREGSLAKLSSLLNREREEYRNVIYLDAGDYLQGSIEAYHDMTSQFYRRSLTAQAYNLLGCDAIAMGNHEFAVGSKGYYQFFQSIKCPVLCANAYYDEPGDFVPAYKILEIQGVRFAILGLTSSISNWSVPSDRMDVRVRDMVSVANHWIPILREEQKADVVIGLVHSGYDEGTLLEEGINENEVKRMVSLVQGFDLVVYGHDHDERIEQITDPDGKRVLVVNPGPYANNAAAVTLSVCKSDAAKPQVTASGKIIPLADEQPDKSFLNALSAWYDDVRNYSDSIIGSFAAPIDCKGVLWGESSLMDYQHSVQMRFCEAEVSLTSPVMKVGRIEAGPLSIKESFGLYEYDNTIVALMLKGSEIKSVLESSYNLFYNTVNSESEHLLNIKTNASGDGTEPVANYASFVSAAGIDYTVNVTKPQGERVTILSMSGGAQFDLDRLYRTSVTSYMYSSPKSPLLQATGMSKRELMRRLVLSSESDIRYSMLTELELNKKDGRSVEVKPLDNWRLVPQKVVGDFLRRDTVNFSFIN